MRPARVVGRVGALTYSIGSEPGAVLRERRDHFRGLGFPCLGSIETMAMQVSSIDILLLHIHSVTHFDAEAWSVWLRRYSKAAQQESSHSVTGYVQSSSHLSKTLEAFEPHLSTICYSIDQTDKVQKGRRKQFEPARPKPIAIA